VSLPAAQHIVAGINQLLPGCPLHIHVAEQRAEVDECLAVHHRRPVELLLDSFDVDARWCLIHATHLTPDELQRLARSGATVCLCPTTEANLGDGFFSAETFTVSHGGSFAIGTDSNVHVSPLDELRMLEYGQRLSTQRRVILADSTGSCGNFLYQGAVDGGDAASGFGSSAISPGNCVSLSLLDPEFLELDCPKGEIATVPDERILDYLVFRSTVPGRGLSGYPGW
jgi:formimidoylglutamate deiminase